MDLEQRVSDERKKWDVYVPQAYPKMRYRGIDQAPGYEYVIVADERQEDEKAREGYDKQSPGEAIRAHEALKADIGVAAAERAAADRKLSALAQAEAKKAEEANDGQHLGEVPVTPIRKKAPFTRALTPADLPSTDDTL